MSLSGPPLGICHFPSCSRGPAGWVQCLHTHSCAVHPIGIRAFGAETLHVGVSSHLDKPSRLPDCTGLGCRTAKHVLTLHSKANFSMFLTMGMWVDALMGIIYVLSKWEDASLGYCWSVQRGLRNWCLTQNLVYKRKCMPLFLSVCLGIKLSSALLFFFFLFCHGILLLFVTARKITEQVTSQVKWNGNNICPQKSI